MNAINIWTYGLADQVQTFLVRPGLLVAALGWLCLAAAVVVLGRSLDWEKVRGAPLTPLTLGLTTLVAQLASLGPAISSRPRAAGLSPLFVAVAERFSPEAALSYGITWSVLFAVLSCELYAYYLVNRESLFVSRPVPLRQFIQQAGRGSEGLFGAPRRVLIAFCLSALGPFWFYVAIADATATTVWAARLPAIPLALAAWLLGSAAVFLFVTHKANMRHLASRRGRPRLWLVGKASRPSPARGFSPPESAMRTQSTDGEPCPPPAA